MFDPEFDCTYTINAAGLIFSSDELAPDVMLDRDADVSSWDGWDTLKGYTGQHGYNGAVMHPSEQWGSWAVDALRELADDGPVTFAVVEVRDEDGSLPEGDAIGWAVAYRTHTL